MDSGIFWELKAKSMPHVISWHDVVVPELGNFRVWIHALGSFFLSDLMEKPHDQGSSRLQFKVVGVEIQSQGDKFSSINNEEKISRLIVASHQKEMPSQNLRAALFRGLPYSKIEEEHLKCMRAFRKKIEDEHRKPLRLASVDSVSTIMFKNGKTGSPIESAIRNKLEIASTKADSIAIAKIYSELSKSGSGNIVKQICVDLDVESRTIYAALRVARSQGWLSASGKGKSGGTLTKEGEKFFIESAGAAKLTNWISQGRGASK